MTNIFQKKGFLLAALVVLIIIIGIIYSIFFSPSLSKNDAINTNTGTTGINNTDTNSGNMKTFNISAKNFEFLTKEIKVKKGDTVKIILTSESGFHDWKIDEFNAGTKKLNTGEIDTVQFKADKSGTFEYYCSVGTHRQMGMRGNLIVE